MALAMLLLTVQVASAQPGENLIASPGFANGLDGWEVVNPVGEGVVVEVVDGALRAASTHPTDNRPTGVRQSVTVEGGRTYLLSARARNTALRSSGGIRVTIRGAGGTALSERWEVQLHNWESGWTPYDRVVRVPPQGRTVELLLSVNGEGTVWIDDVSLMEGEPPRNPADERVGPVPTGITVERIPLPSPAITVCAADVDGDGADELLAGCLDERVRLVDEGKVVWEAEMGGLPCDVAVSSDGSRIAVSTMDVAESIVGLSSEGEELWRRPLDDNRVAQVAWADLSGDGSDELLVGSGPRLWAYDADLAELWQVDVGGPRMVALTAADVDGDGRKEALAGYEAQTLRVLAVDDDGAILWRYQPTDWAGGVAVSSLFAADIDGDGPPEVVGATSGRHSFALGADGTLRWRGQGPGRQRDTFLAEPVEYASGRSGTEIALFARHDMAVRAGSGPVIYQGGTGITVIDAAPGTTEPNVVYLASSNLRDASAYRLTFTEGGRNGLAGHAPGDRIGEVLDALFTEATRAPRRDTPTDRKFHVLLYRNSREQVQAVWPTLKARSNEYVEYEILSYVKELPVELHRFPTTTRPEILDYVGFYEDEGIPFSLFVDHGCRPWITVETARRIVETAPTAFRAFYVAEDNYDYPGKLFWDWLDWLEDIIELCHERGKRVILKEMHDSWSVLASDPRVYEVVFRYPETAVPMFATNNPQGPELQVGGMVGLWRAGACDDWGMSSQDWTWNWGKAGLRIDFADVCPPDIILRMDLAAAAMGCTYFHVEGGQQWLHNSGELDPESRRHRELLYQLMERGLVVPVGRDQVAGLSPVGIARTTDPARANGARIGLPTARLGTPFAEGLLGMRQSIQTVSPEYLPGYAYGLRRYSEGLFPRTPYGFVQLVPAFAEGRNRIAEALIETDTRSAVVDGGEVPAAEARAAIQELLAERAASLPFSCGDAFLAAQELGDRFRLTLIDPEYLNPSGLDATVRVSLPDPPGDLTDLLTGETLEVRDGGFTASIPPGGFRLLECRLAR